MLDVPPSCPKPARSAYGAPEMLWVLAAGRMSQAIARKVIVAIGTVKRYISHILGQQGVQCRIEAAIHSHEFRPCRKGWRELPQGLCVLTV